MESQKIRSQVMGFKITFVTAMIGLMANGLNSIDKALFVIPAFAAICFDFIIYSYSFSIKRIGSYTRDHIEPLLRNQEQLPVGFALWQEFLTEPKTRQNLAIYGNLGLTMLSVALSVIVLFTPFRPIFSLPLLGVLSIFVFLDVIAYRSPKKLGKLWKGELLSDF